MLVNPVVFVYWVVSAVAAVLYFSGTMRAGVLGVSLVDESLGPVFGLLGGVLLGLVTWPFVLMVVWWGRRAYLRRVGTPVTATVIESGRRVTTTENNPFATHRVRLKVTFTHPSTGVEYWAKKEFAMAEFRRSTAKAMLHQFPIGAEMPMLVRGRAGGFDVRHRPQWVDLW
ncbi:hypothetical protein ACFWU5_13690 [Nocardia sp. NPDC058640]|uniref:hypothetical protein n=1 Tax=Nocardia sp. NPDC058640 TaxID=3346571 RepID=UPI00365E7187